MNKVKENIKNNYSLPNNFRLSLLREGPDNNVYVVTNPKGKKRMVIRVNKRGIENDVRFEILWLVELDTHGVPVPKVIKTKYGDNFFIDQNQVYVAFKYIQGKHLDLTHKTEPSLKKIKNAAFALAQLHNASLKIDLVLPSKRTILTEINRGLEIRDKLIQSSEGGKKFVGELLFYQQWAKKNSNKKYLVHNDYRVGNVFFEGEQVKSILDFDWACKGPAIKDVAHSLVEWSFPDGTTEPNQKVFDTFLAGYNQEAKNKIKLNSTLRNWICFSCLSDTATYFSDLAQENIFKKISSSYMYKKFEYFHDLL